jgi:hypothetical protein
MVRWAEVGEDAPEFAARVQAAFQRNTHMTLATLRRDGSPRISGTEIQFEDGEVLVGMMLRSRKALDLLRDPRIAVHGPTADPPEEAKEWVGEAKLSGRAIDIAGNEPEPEAHSFRIDVDEVVLTHLNDAGDRLVVEWWQPGRGIQLVERE